MLPDFRTPKPILGRVIGEKHIDVHENAMLSRKSILHNKVKRTKDIGDINKLGSVAQNTHPGRFSPNIFLPFFPT